MNVVGLDLSLTATGICTADQCATIKVRSNGMKRLLDIREALVDHGLCAADVVVIEGYSFGSMNSHAHALGELGGHIRLCLYQAEIRYVDIPPAVLKKFATGKGNANKDVMVATAARAGCPADDNNAVDAWWLRQLGSYAYADAALPITGYRDEAVAKIDWPQFEVPA
jgi:crossover junction endodeoxyribonuclease RuvC